MANSIQKPSPSETHSTSRKLQVLWSKKKTKPPLLPPLQPQAGSGGHNKSKIKTFAKFQPVSYRKPTMAATRQPRTHLDPFARETTDGGKTQAQIRLTRTMLRNRRAALQELSNQEHFLSKLNEELMRTIQDMEDSTALSVREMLHQQDTLASVVNILEYSNQRRLQQLKAEFQEWQDQEKHKISCLEQQVRHLDAQNWKIQDQVHFLSTYMDHEYPVKLVQIAGLGRQLQQAKEHQQDELNDFSKMRRQILTSVWAKIREKHQRSLRLLVAKTQRPHEEELLRKMLENRFMQKCSSRFREFISEFKRQIPVLRTEVRALQAQMWNPREIVFEDILLRTPKCTPDMDIIINIPVEEELPF
ncbi:uncharacterized protein C20orf96 homolog isoform X2 [Ochotona princeps]|uniref:uncharacterized protein C20orf96 homolog isoform X2 n=1 Tax=Ochotona princeps TaxID=9978 RepID=UPI00271483E3|nr:uncharacterized protein C20orf96 homolog isoform X2 [Ochotona princeps]